MGKKRTRKSIESLRARIQEHEYKIRDEQEKAHPDKGAIAHWVREINAFQRQLSAREEKLTRKMKRRRRS